MTSSFNRETSVRWSSSSLEGGGGTIQAIEGGATSRTLSARVASSLRVHMSPEEASTIHTFRGRCWRELADERAVGSGSIVCQQLLHPADSCVGW